MPEIPPAALKKRRCKLCNKRGHNRRRCPMNLTSKIKAGVNIPPETAVIVTTRRPSRSLSKEKDTFLKTVEVEEEKTELEIVEEEEVNADGGYLNGTTEKLGDSEDVYLVCDEAATESDHSDDVPRDDPVVTGK
ncbi:unnamed protein product [Notodromas monacha]|uniref:CCHC-type domain-containing protein n=1 Tax=Notodromas monacha TaxID=399045 RepID=A0A7R9BK30_9CRUS|nr:unnamed protein product [Notodromas monacha]CAG0915605.1 unnamed protein product [Notodromas monacha]